MQFAKATLNTSSEEHFQRLPVMTQLIVDMRINYEEAGRNAREPGFGSTLVLESSALLVPTYRYTSSMFSTPAWFVSIVLDSPRG